MASTRAIAAVSDAIVVVLERAADVDDAIDVTVDHITGKGLQAPPDENGATVSIWLHRVEVNPMRRHLTARRTPAGDLLAQPLALDLHYLVMAWAGSALIEQQLLGWALRVLEDHTTIPPGLLNQGPWTGVFHDDETVELTWAPLTAQEESDLWQVAQQARRPSASYVARMVGIESARTIEEHAPVRTRRFEVTGAPS